MVWAASLVVRLRSKKSFKRGTLQMVSPAMSPQKTSRMIPSTSAPSPLVLHLRRSSSTSIRDPPIFGSVSDSPRRLANVLIGRQVWSTELPKSTNTSGHNVFDPKKSSTFKKTVGSSWKISYGDGSNASGDVGTDNVDVGGLVIQKQSIELAKTLSAQFSSGVGDGLLGLAFGSINTVAPKPVATPVENMIAQTDIPKISELFTAYLGSYKDKNDPDHGASFYTFGYLDEKALNGQTPYYTPIDNSKGFWQFNSTTASVGSKKIQRAGNTAIADTGTTLALVDDSLCKAIYDAIPGAKYDDQQQGYLIPSNITVDQLPVVSFDVGGKEFAVQKEDLTFADAGDGFTYGGIQSRGDLPFDILGDTWLKGIYAV